MGGIEDRNDWLIQYIVFKAESESYRKDALKKFKCLGLNNVFLDARSLPLKENIARYETETVKVAMCYAA